MTANSFGSLATLRVGGAGYQIHRLGAVDGSADLPFSLKILLENLLRTEDGRNITAEHVSALAQWDPAAEPLDRDPVHPGPGAPAGPDRRAGRRGPGHHARGHAGPGR